METAKMESINWEISECRLSFPALLYHIKCNLSNDYGAYPFILNTLQLIYVFGHFCFCVIIDVWFSIFMHAV